jgi:hypothetical protein
VPTLELHGFDAEAGERLVRSARERLAGLPYREDIVFDLTRAGGRVLGWDGQDRPFVRVCSRSEAKLDELRALLVDLADVETLLIGYFPRTARAGKA